MKALLKKGVVWLGVDTSLIRRLRFSFIVIVLLLALPALISVGMMRSYSDSYHAVIQRMQQISTLKPIVLDRVPDELFSIIAGRVSFEDSSVWENINAVNARLDELTGGDITDTEMIVARRTMNTLSNYVSRMEGLLGSQAPVAESELLLEEVRSVAKLVGAMLDECIDKEILNAGNTSERLQAAISISLMVEFVLLAACVAFALFAERSLRNSIREPIMRLETLAGNLASGDLSARAPQANIEELLSLTNSLNVMGDKLQTLIDENRREQENLKKSELRILQAQIAPHFLYNTLDAIVWLAEEKRSGEVIRITKALSDFYRISLSQGMDWITVKQERMHIEGYMTIQQVRYRDILDYEIDIAEELNERVMHKLLLQPLIENAIYHGIKHKRGRGFISIRGELEHDMMRFVVKDNGAGMSKERLSQVRAMLNNDERPEVGSAGYGMYNVSQRIQLYYNQREGLSISSDESGTTVSFRVPANMRNEG